MNATCDHVCESSATGPSASIEPSENALQASIAGQPPTSAGSTPAAPTPPETLLRTTHDRRRIDVWALVLVSKGVQHFVYWSEVGFELHAVPEHYAVARAELAAADLEEAEAQRARREEATRKHKPATRYSALGGLLVSFALLAFFLVTGPRAGGPDWFSAGASDAERVLHGEWWRTVTALTLHADGAHVASNIGIGALVVGAVMRTEGVGWGALLVLASGTVGNLMNAWAHQSFHSSVGFSTAVFGAIGLLGGLAYARSGKRVQGASVVRPAWTALGGSLALLAALGSSERSDLFAHLFGGLSGVGFGLAAGWTRWRPESALGQWVAGFGTAAAVVGAWLVALG